MNRLLALLGLALVSRSDASMLEGIKGFDACLVHKMPAEDGDLYVVIGVRPTTDSEFLAALGIKEGGQ